MTVEQPFSALHSQRLFLLTDGCREALARLDEGLGAREPFVLVTGAAGTGKTALVLEAIARWGTRVDAASVSNPALTRTELIEEIARRFGSDPPAGASKPHLLACLDGVLAEVASRDRIAVLVIEDAHELAHDLFDELRLVANAQAQAGRRLEIVLVGLPALDETLADPELAALRQRIAVHCRMTTLTQRETRLYLHHRVNVTGGDGPRLFPRKTCSDLHARTGGVPRSINTLASEALRRARESGSSAVTSDHVRAAATVVRVSATAEPSVVSGANATSPEPEIDDEVASRESSAAVESASPASADPAPARTERIAEPAAAKSADRIERVDKAAAAEPPARVERIEKPAATERSNRTEPVVETVAAEPPARTEPVAQPAEAAIESSDPRARAWVRRFIGDEGPPRFGVRLAFDASEFDDSDKVAEASAPDDSALDGVFEPETPAEPPPTRSKPDHRRSDSARSTPSHAPGKKGNRKGRDREPVRTPPSIDVAPEPTPAVELAPVAVSLPPATPGPRESTSTWGPLHTAAVVLMVLAALAVLVLPRAHRLVSRPAASPSSLNDSPASTPIASVTPPNPPAIVESRERESDSVDSLTTTPSSAPAAAATDEVTPLAEPADTTVNRRFALDVATFIDKGRASDERERLASLANLTGSVIPGDGGHHVLLGFFSTRRRAETAANVLLERGIIWQARVISVPDRSDR